MESWIRSRLPIVAGLLLLATVAPLFGATAWWLDLASHFVAYRLAIALWFLLMAALIRSRWAIGLLVLVALLEITRLVPLYLPGPGEAGTERWSVLHLNVWTMNEDEAAVVEHLRATPADFVLLSEVNERWRDALIARPPEGHRVLLDAAREDNFGMLVLTRVATATATLRTNNPFGLPEVAVHAERDGETLNLLYTHPPPPISPAMSDVRDRQLLAAGDWARAREGPTVVVGDFNATPWSSTFDALVHLSGLESSQSGFGYQATWRPLPGAWLPIDHLLHSSGLSVLERRVGPDVGSDHRSLFVSLGS